MMVTGVAGAATVTVTLRDANGNQAISSGATVIIGLGLGAANGVFGTLTNNGDGTYSATFTGLAAGTNTVTAFINGSPITSTLPTILA